TTLFVGYGGGGFGNIDKGFETFTEKIQENIKNEKIILLTHGPPYGTKLDHIYKHYAGNISYRKFITKQKNTILAISGHLHETIGAQDQLGSTLLINPGPYGVVIEL
ncbi:metallophosphoesterase family protein, partial [Candidatus Woesearchaeota archaeon]|nr:metallophosphoesterase family protein [Candidatus Woesearchaeota archaeon]